MRSIISHLQRRPGTLWLPLIGFAVVLGTVIGLVSYVPRQAVHAATPDWSTFLGGNARTDYNATETTINSTTAPNLKVHWTASSTAHSYITAQVIVANSILYWGTWDGVMHATDPNSGNQIWATSLSTTPGGCSKRPKGVISSPVVATVPVSGTPTSVLFVGAGAANLYALDALKGTILWQVNLENSPVAFIYDTPTYYNGSLYVGVASTGDCPLVTGEVVKVDASTGQIQNTFTLVPSGCIGSSVWGAIAIDESTGMIYFGTGNASTSTCTQLIPYAQAVVELRASDLSFVTLWQVPKADTVGKDDDFGSAPTLFTAIIGGVTHAMLGIVNKDGYYYAFDRTNISGGPLWKVRLSVGGSTPSKNAGIASAAYDGSYLYAAEPQTTIGSQLCLGSLQKLDPNNNGAALWADCLPGAVQAPTFGVPGLVIVGAANTMYIVDSNTGQILYSYQDTTTNGGFWGGATISGGVLYEGSRSGQLFAFGL